MKKFICIALVLALLLSLVCGCAGKKASTVAEENGGKFSFSAQGIDGKTYTMDDFKDAKVIMINYWEPWCSPCTSEMPDLETLYEKYKDKGFAILGVYTTENSDDDVRSVISSCGITYPIVFADALLGQYSQSYVPSTIFVSADGTLLTDECVAGSQDLETWENMIVEYLTK